MTKHLILFSRFILIFNILNTLFAFQFQLLGPIFMSRDEFPYYYQHRSLTSFIILTILSYSFFFLFRKATYEGLKSRVVIFFILSTWFQYLSVQFIGISPGPYRVENSNHDAYRISEYYSFINFNRGDFIEKSPCYDMLNAMEASRVFLKCNTDLDISLLESAFFKKYKISKDKYIYVLDGVGPFFNLSISNSASEHDRYQEYFFYE